MNIQRLGRIAYPVGLELQTAARARVAAGAPDELLLLEHESVVTLGCRGGLFDAVALDRLGIPVVRTDRGGLATWHGPGQLVAYPIVDLARAGRDVPGFIAELGALLIDLAAAFGVNRVTYDVSRPGAYVGPRKLGSIGLHIRRGVTTHGLALNIDCALDGFRAIVPCGCADMPITTLVREGARAEAGAAPTVCDAADWLARELPRRLARSVPAQPAL